jgi:hypothetical protein
VRARVRALVHVAVGACTCACVCLRARASVRVHTLRRTRTLRSKTAALVRTRPTAATRAAYLRAGGGTPPRRWGYLGVPPPRRWGYPHHAGEGTPTTSVGSQQRAAHMSRSSPGWRFAWRCRAPGGTCGAAASVRPSRSALHVAEVSAFPVRMRVTALLWMHQPAHRPPAKRRCGHARAAPRDA